MTGPDPLDEAFRRLARWYQPGEAAVPAATTYTGRLIYACPDCEADLEEDTFALRCPSCEAEVPLSEIVIDRESDPWF